MKLSRIILFLWFVFLSFAETPIAQTTKQTVRFSLADQGWIPVWLVAGPFQQPIVGLGGIGDEDVIGEKTIEPFEGKAEGNALVEGGVVFWKPQSITNDGYMDFNASMGWVKPGRLPEKIWKAKAGYACTYLESFIERGAFLLVGSNSQMKIYLNHKLVYAYQNPRNAQADDDTVKVRLQKGRNILLLRVMNSHINESVRFFHPIKWEWGFYARLVSLENRPLENVQVHLPIESRGVSFDLVSTFFFKKAGPGLQQRFELVIVSNNPEMLSGECTILIDGKVHNFHLKNVPFGESRHEVYLPEVVMETEAECVLQLNDGKVLKKRVVLRPQKHYELYLMLLTHMDIGYTHPQPIVKELHVRTLDDVLQMCEQYPDFRWTIETVWMLEQYEKARPGEHFEKLIAYVKEGRVSVSPIYTNPFTGWVSVEELIHSIFKAHEYAKRFELNFPAAVYNDVPGFSWMLPQVLSDTGSHFLVCGLNEMFNDYQLQQTLPKVFYWQGSDKDKVLTYLTESYNEGVDYGFEKGLAAMQYRMWQRLNKLQAWGYPYEMVLVNSVFMDNGGIPKNQFVAAKDWNRCFAYPKIVISTLSHFAEEFTRRYAGQIPTLRGDWTSTWDSFYQGEPARMLRQRWVQHQLLSAEKMATISWLRDSKQNPLQAEINKAYQSLLHFSGHGSGLEYGFGSPRENEITMAYREEYTQDAVLTTEEVLERSIHRLTKSHESFAGEALYVFNPLSWKRDAVVEVQFPQEKHQPYQVIDLVSKQAVPCYRKGYTLFFLAKSLPSVGYKKFRLQPVAIATDEIATGLRLSANAIENQFYRIEVNRSTGSVLSMVDKKSGQELLDSASDFPFNEPMRERFQLHEAYTPVMTEDVQMEIRDEHPVRLVLVIRRTHNLFEKTQYILWDNLDRVDIVHSINLEVLQRPEFFEEYGVAFPFAVPDHETAVEVLGGFLQPHKDRLPGIEHDIFSIRRSVAIYNQQRCITWATKDSRVIRLRKTASDSNGVLIANLVNNFPDAWNRNEENRRVLDYHFSFACREGTFRPEFTSRFGWEISTPATVQRSWLRSEPAEKSYIEVQGDNVILVTMKPAKAGPGYILRFMNVDPKNSADAYVTSELFKGHQAFRSSLREHKDDILELKNNTCFIKLEPNEIFTMLLAPVMKASNGSNAIEKNSIELNKIPKGGDY